MHKEYIIAFSSFYKAAYAEELLDNEGIRTTLRKLPIEIAKSCSTGLVYKGDDIEALKKVFENKGISTRGIYLVDKDGKNKAKYILVR